MDVCMDTVGYLYLHMIRKLQCINLFDISINMLQSSKEMCMYVCMSTKLE